MRCKAHRFALSAALCCCSLLLAVSIAAPAGAGSSASLPTWVQVFTWSGGGEGNDIRNSAPFTLQGGQQIFRSSAAAVPGEYSSPSSGWTVESADSGWEFEMIETPGMGESESRLYLPAGSYFVGSNTLDCTWTVVISEMRPTPTPTPIPTPTPTVTPKVTLKLSGLKSGAVTLGKSVTARGTVTPSSLAGSKVTLTAQLKKSAKWVKVKSVARTISTSGAYIWKYKPAKRGAYRMRATIAKTAAHTAARTKWRPFKVE